MCILIYFATSVYRCSPYLASRLASRKDQYELGDISRYGIPEQVIRREERNKEEKENSEEMEKTRRKS
jgi:hypothetical protein